MEVAIDSLKSLHRNNFFPKYGIDFEQSPASLKQLHKHIACMCMLTIGCQQKGFDQQRTLARFEPKHDDSIFPKKHDFLKKSIIEVGSEDIRIGTTSQQQRTGSKLARKRSTQMNLDLNSTTTIQELKQFYDQNTDRGSKSKSQSKKQMQGSSSVKRRSTINSNFQRKQTTGVSKKGADSKEKQKAVATLP